ncbi:hypothetical protein THAR02_11425 [Trichoderma harzianum]|uniref:Uncharacterized protein n=1 Tax=Trichoderma harzianum TaxID=5544 RepID=A0A0F9ZTL9_TRIHA|nr:hypothetical protein THAR02_11425 [Trichoderma harzianum]
MPSPDHRLGYENNDAVVQYDAHSVSNVSPSQLQGGVVIVGITAKSFRARHVLVLISYALLPYTLNITSVSSQSGNMSCGSFNVAKGGRFSAALLQTSDRTRDPAIDVSAAFPLRESKYKYYSGSAPNIERATQRRRPHFPAGQFGILYLICDGLNC